MPRIMALIFIKIGLKLSYFCQKKVFFRVLVDPIPTPYASGGWGSCPQTPIVSGGWGIRSQTHNASFIADFWLRACMKKNLLYVTAGLHLY